MISLAGESSTQSLLILSQVVLSLQLSFAVIPLIHFTSNRLNMGEFATPWWGKLLAWTTAAIIVGLNGKLVLDQVAEWVSLAAESAIWVGPIPLELGGGSLSLRIGRQRGRVFGLGDDQAVLAAVAGLETSAQREAQLGRGVAAAPRWAGSAWRSSTILPTPRS